MPSSIQKASGSTTGAIPAPVPAAVGDTPGLEIALLRRSLSGLTAESERCGCCERHMLIGERVYEYASGETRCALCRERERNVPADSRRVHGPAFGHSIRVIAGRAA